MQDIARYIDSWENYRILIKMANTNVTRTFLTYLDERSQDKLQSLSTEEKDDWQTAQSRIKEILEPASGRLMAQMELTAAAQSIDESVEEFIERISRLASKAYKDSEIVMREKKSVEALISGLKSTEIVSAIVSKYGAEVNFKEAAEQSRVLGATLEARAMI